MTTAFPGCESASRASSGIGAATAAALAQDGWQVIVAARRSEFVRTRTHHDRYCADIT
ncbi:hypothetical protein HX613_09070 [Brevibacterium sp. UCMA 11754]|nr:hypothetical protein [Brevibacterium sp. UCMA 11754]